MYLRQIFQVAVMAAVIQSTALSQDLPLATKLSSGLLALPAVREELELTPEQVEWFTKINENSKEVPANLLDVAREIQAKQPEQRKSLNEIVRDLYIERIRANDKMVKSEILVPHQVARLDQLSKRLEMARIGFAKFLFANMRTMSDIEEEREKQIKKDFEEIKRELLRDIQKLKDSAERKMIEALDQEMQEEFQEKLGEPFHLTLKSPD